MNKIILYILIGFLVSGVIFAQDQEEISVLDLFASMADNAVEEIRQNTGRGGSLYCDGLTFNNRPSQLGALYKSVLLARLSEASISNLNLYGEIPAVLQEPSYLLSGEFFRLDEQVYVSLALKKGDDDRILMVLEETVPLTREVTLLLSGGFGGGFSSAGDSYEPNNDPGSGYPVEFGSRIEDLTLEPSGDQDWFLLEVMDEEDLFVTIGTTGNLDTVMELYGPDNPGSMIASNDDGDTGSNALIQTAITQPGVYFAKVSGYGSDDTGNYGLFIEREEYVAEEGEPNNSRNEAEYIPGFDLMVEKKLFPMGDEDWYRLDLSGASLSADDSVQVKTLGTLDTYMELYQGATMLMSNDDGATDGNASIIFVPEDGAEYTVLVRGYSSSTLGDYQLAVNSIVVQLDIYEPNDIMEEATPIELNTTQAHTLIMSDSMDWFTFSLNRPDNINFETYGDMDTYVILYDSQGNVIQESDDDGTGYNGKVSQYLQRGTYYCSVNLYSSGSEYTEYTAGLSSN